MENYKTNSQWCLWFHSLNNEKWTKRSYKNLFKINNLFDYHFLKKTFEKQHLQNGMFFVMIDIFFQHGKILIIALEDVISYKVDSDNILDSWNKLLLFLISENIVVNLDLFSEINGISIAPKKEFNIIKIWIRNDKLNYKNLVKDINPYFEIEKSLYKKHELEY